MSMTREGSVSLRTPELSWAVAGVGVFPSAGVFSMCLRAIFNTRTSTWRAREEPRTSPRTPLCRSQHTTSRIFSVCRVRARPHKREGTQVTTTYKKKYVCWRNESLCAGSCVDVDSKYVEYKKADELTVLVLCSHFHARVLTPSFSHGRTCAPRACPQNAHTASSMRASYIRKR